VRHEKELTHRPGPTRKWTFNVDGVSEMIAAGKKLSRRAAVAVCGRVVERSDANGDRR
jgi:hypothetical protein